MLEGRAQVQLECQLMRRSATPSCHLIVLLLGGERGQQESLKEGVADGMSSRGRSRGRSDVTAGVTRSRLFARPEASLIRIVCEARGLSHSTPG